MDAEVLRDDDGSKIAPVLDWLVIQDKTELYYHVCCDCGNVHRVWIDWTYHPDHRARWEVPDLQTVPPNTVEYVKNSRRRFIEYIAQLAGEGKTVDEIIDLTLNAHPHGTAAPAGTVQGEVGTLDRKEGGE